jgi:hypothetical protein
VNVLKSFRVARFELSLRALDPLKLPPHAGSTLRGGFGRAFRRIGCAASALGADQCSLGDRCPYHYIFETPVPAGSPILSRVTTAPRPFVIEPPLDTHATYEPGAHVTVGLVLIGRAIDYLPYFIYAFEQLGSAGLGTGRGKFRVDSVMSAPLGGPATSIYDGSRQLLATRVASFGLDGMSPAPDGESTTITLRFLTPTRLVHNARAGTPADFHVLFRNVLRRVNFLNHFHCGGDLRDDAGKLVEVSRAIRTVDSRLQWQQWDRYSARQDQRVPMGGCVGDAEYHGDFAPLWPWLALGEWVHVGKGSTFGLGQYVISKFDGGEWRGRHHG